MLLVFQVCKPEPQFLICVVETIVLIFKFAKRARKAVCDVQAKAPLLLSNLLFIPSHPHLLCCSGAQEPPPNGLNGLYLPLPLPPQGTHNPQPHLLSPLLPTGSASPPGTPAAVLPRL